VSGPGLTRRAALVRFGLGGAALALGAAGCGDDVGPLKGEHTEEVARTSIAIDYASYYAPVKDLTRLAQARAAERRLALRFSADAAGAAAQVASLKALTGARGGFKVVVVAPFDAAALASVVEDAAGRGIAIVSFVSPLPGATVAIRVDPAGAARRLVAHAAGEGKRRVLLVAPPARSPVPDPFFGSASQLADALAAEVARAGLDVVGSVTALGTPDAEAAVRGAAGKGADAVLTWNDATALGAAAAVPRDGYVGGLGAPAVTTAAALRALDGDGPLRCLVAARVADLARALVDVPAAVLAQRAVPAGGVVPARVLLRGGAATRAALGDYAA
jgi:hypothetical protein